MHARGRTFSPHWIVSVQIHPNIARCQHSTILSPEWLLVKDICVAIDVENRDDPRLKIVDVVSVIWLQQQSDGPERDLWGHNLTAVVCCDNQHIRFIFVNFHIVRDLSTQTGGVARTYVRGAWWRWWI